MTSFEKRVERALAALGPLPQKMTFIYEDGDRVEVVGFLAAARQNSKRAGLVDVLGATEGQKNFFMCAQVDAKALWADEAGGGQDEPAGNTGVDGQGLAVCAGPSSDRPPVLGESQDGRMRGQRGGEDVRRPPCSRLYRGSCGR